MTKSQTTEERLQSEAAFHNSVYSTNTRVGAEKFYTITRSSRGDFQRLLFMDIHGKKILEYGCGQGERTLELALAGAEVHGIDISSVAVGQGTEKAGKLGANARFYVMDAENTDFPDGEFDIVCGTSILHHLDLEKCYAEIARLLRPGGRGIFTEPLGHNPLINWYRNRTPQMRTPDEHPLLMNDLRLAKKYFRNVEIKYYHLLDLAVVPLRNLAVFPAAQSFGAKSDQMLFKLFPLAKRWAWIVNMVLTK
jgi:SAM-dependent methyltransferase